MARPREFDADDALERVTRVFWNRGFEHTSLDDLCAATGLGRSSLYAAFGDKRALYLKALARYEERSVALGVWMQKIKRIRSHLLRAT